VGGKSFHSNFTLFSKNIRIVFSVFVAIFEQAFTPLQENGNEEGLGRSL